MLTSYYNIVVYRVGSIYRYYKRQSTDSGVKGENPILAYIKKRSVEPSKSRSQSAPSIVHLASSQVKFEKKVKTALVSPRKVKKDSSGHSNTDEELTPLQQKTDENEVVFDYDLTDYPTWGSDEELSRQASSYITENTDDSLTGVLDNRVCVYPPSKYSKISLFRVSIIRQPRVF